MKYYFPFILAIGVLFGCNRGSENHPNISGIKPNFETIRMDQKIMELDTLDFNSSLDGMMLEHPEFMKLYIENIMGFGSLEMEDYVDNAQLFIKEKRIKELYTDVQKVYPDLETIERDFRKAFAYYKHYFPERTIPNIYTFFSEFSLQRFVFVDKTGDDALGIGLDLFLGSSYPYQEYFPDNPAFSSYLVRRYNEEHIVKRCMEALILDVMPTNRDNRMLGQMIHNGKKIFILNKILPQSPDSILLEYTEEQLRWCEDNEIEMWAYFLKEDLFYDSDINKINKLVNPSPSSPGMPKMAPGRTGNYIGWKIVEAFMKRNPETTIEELINMADAQEILKRSRFKPRK